VACSTRQRHWSRASPARRTTWNGSITATASGSSSLVAALKPVNPSIDHLDAVAPGRVSLAEPGLEHLLRSAPGHTQQPRRTGTVPDRRQVDDHGDVLIAAACVAPAVLVDADHAHAVEPVWVLDQHTPALGQHSVIRGDPRHAEALGDPSDGQVLTHDAF
jgi:hypothetical protein